VGVRGCAEEGGAPFRFLGRVMKAHARIIWACSWTPDGLRFATGARDSSVKVWALPAPGQGVHLAITCLCECLYGVHIVQPHWPLEANNHTLPACLHPRCSCDCWLEV
jgi:WD40 repeat protein